MTTVFSGDTGADTVAPNTVGATQVIDASIPLAKLTVALPFTKEYVSAEQTITAAGALTLAHGLGATPKLTQCSFVCKTADGGYSIGDVVDYMTFDYFATGGPGVIGVAVVRGAANIEVRYSSNPNVFVLIHKTTGAVHIPTLASWRLVVRAWA